ncbi:hypothetical protein C3L33_14715, partial [Rhododendron williamsianum]
MQDFCMQDSDLSSAQSMAPYVAKGASWWMSSGSQIEQSFVSKNLSLNMLTPNQLGQNVKQMVFQFQDQDSSSTQSTSQSYHEAASVGSIISLQSGYSGTLGKPTVGRTKAAVLMGTQDCLLPPSELNYGQSIACVPLSYGDSYYSGLVAAYGAQAMVLTTEVSPDSSSPNGGDAICSSAAAS